MASYLNKVSLIYPIIVAILTWPLLAANFSFFSRTWIWLLIGCGLVGVSCPRYYRQPSMIWMALYIIIVLSNYAMGDIYYDSLPRAFSEFAILLFSSAIAYYCFQSENKRTASLILITIVLIVAFTSVATYILDLEMPGIVRYGSNSISQKEGEYGNLSTYYRMGLTNYSLPHTLPVAIPPLIMGIKNKNLSVLFRTLIAVFLVTIILLIFISDIATAILLAVIALLFSLFSKRGGMRRNIILIVVILLIAIPLLANDSLLVGFIDYIESIIGKRGTVSVRLDDIKESILYGESMGDLEIRMEQYNKSSQVFQSSILVGGNNEVGGHSAIIDRLATLGLVGLFPWIIFIGQNIRMAFRRVSSQYQIYYIESLIVAIMMLVSKSTSTWEMWLMIFVVVPLMIDCFGRNNKKLSRTNS